VLRCLGLAALALLLAVPAAAAEFPALSGRVVDAANLLSPGTEAALSARLERLQDETGRQLVVATLPSLGGYEIEEYGYRLGRAWGIGQQGEDNGALLIVAPNERKVRIEVGYGLEAYLTDAWSSVIIQREIVPRFKAGDMEGGIVAGTEAIASQLSLPADAAAANLAAARARAADDRDGGGWPLGLVPTLLLIWFVVIMLRGLFRGRRYRRHGPWGGPVIIWGPGSSDWGGGWSGGGGGGFSGGGGSFGGGGASGSW
jgi:uncharacterized protein